jgi:hypothetical protein
VAIALVVLAAIADHAFGWGTGVAVCLTAHSYWRQRRMEARVQRQLKRSRVPPDPSPPGWAADWRLLASQPTSRRNYQ